MAGDETKKKQIKRDAEGQFVRSRHGGDNNGVSSASPRVTTDDDDATFDTDHVVNQRKPVNGAPVNGAKVFGRT